MGTARTLAGFVDTLQAAGRYTFRRQEVSAALGITNSSFNNAARRLRSKGRIASPRRGFYVVVPLEYRSAGAPPPSWFIADLMAFHEQPYYVGLLTAAALHGAAHHRPQEFQVLTSRPLRPVRAGRARIRFLVKKHLARTPVAGVQTQTGTMRVSTPEATALDLVRYVDNVGHLSNVATVLKDLAECMTGARLVRAAKASSELSYAQRVGFLLDFLGTGDLTEPLARWLKDQQSSLAPLRPDLPTKGVQKDERWQILVNECIEVDS